MSTGLFDLLARVVNSKIARARLRQKTYPEFVRSYGAFRIGDEWRSLSVKGIDNESGGIFGQVVKTIEDIENPIGSVLLAGEGAKARQVYAGAIGVAPDLIVTAGLHDDTDHRWDFDNDIKGWNFSTHCEASSADGLLHIESLGNDPFFYTATRVVVPQGGGVRLRVRSVEPDPGSVAEAMGMWFDNFELSWDLCDRTACAPSLVGAESAGRLDELDGGGPRTWWGGTASRPDGRGGFRRARARSYASSLEIPWRRIFL